MFCNINFVFLLNSTLSWLLSVARVLRCQLRRERQPQCHQQHPRTQASAIARSSPAGLQRPQADPQAAAEAAASAATNAPAAAAGASQAAAAAAAAAAAVGVSEAAPNAAHTAHAQRPGCLPHPRGGPATRAAAERLRQPEQPDHHGPPGRHALHPGTQHLGSGGGGLPGLQPGLGAVHGAPPAGAVRAAAATGKQKIDKKYLNLYLNT